MLSHKLVVFPLLVALCSCVVRTEKIDFEGGQLSILPSGEMQIVMETIAPPSTAAQYIVPPTHNSDEVTDAITELRDDFIASNDYFLKCLSNPKKCDATRITAPDTPQRLLLDRKIREYSSANIRIQKGSGVFLVRIDSLGIIDSATAVIDTCTYDSLVMVDVGKTTSTLDDIIFNDAVASYLTRMTLLLDNGSWKWASETRDQTKFNVDQCGFEKP